MDLFSLCLQVAGHILGDQSCQLLLGQPELFVKLASCQASNERGCPPYPVVVPVPTKSRKHVIGNFCQGYSEAHLLTTAWPRRSRSVFLQRVAPACRATPVQKCQRHAEAHPLTTAGPSALAGLMHMELTGPSTHMSNAMASATARGPNLPQPLHASTGVSLWQEPLCMAACNSRPVLAQQGLAGHQWSKRHRSKNSKLHIGKRRS